VANLLMTQQCDHPQKHQPALLPAASPPPALPPAPQSQGARTGVQGTVILGNRSARGRAASLASSARMDVKAGAHRTAILGPQSAHGRVVNIATIVQIHQDAKLGVQQILTTGIPNANGKVARSATAAMPRPAPQSHPSAKNGAQETAMIGLQSARGKVAGNVVIARRIAVSRAARQTRLPKARQFWFDYIYTSLAQCCRCSF